MPARLINIKYITIRAEKVASPVTALHSEGTKRKLLIFCMVLIFALVLTTFGISFIGWTDDIKSHLKRVLRA